MTKQSSFFDIVPPEQGAHRVRVDISKLSHQVYLAIIDDGWWMAYGKTAKDAMDKVAKRYTRDTGTERAG